LKVSQVKNLEKIYRRKVPVNEVIHLDLARQLCSISHEIRRQVGILVNRRGRIVHVLVGDNREIMIPDLTTFRTDVGRLKGLRCIHTHLKGETLTRDDLTDLALLRLDFMGAIEVEEDGQPGNFFGAHVVTKNEEDKTWEVLEKTTMEEFQFSFYDFVESLEEELSRMTVGKTVSKARRAILVSVNGNGKNGSYDSLESLQELEDLATTEDIEVVDRVTQRPAQIHPQFLMGKGKLKDFLIRCLQFNANLIIFDQELSPAQVKSISELTELEIMDRTQLILEIFGRRAHSKDGRVRVDLAKLKYLLPRVSARDDAISRIRGGIGVRGPGETTIEITRRRLQDRIHRLEKELDNLKKGRRQRNSKRLGSGLPLVSIIGYTNAGKSTLFNQLTRSSVLVEDKLFATLDPTARRLRLAGGEEIVISDTVGFIRNLPKDLLGAFRATLEELRDADLLLHLVDISYPDCEENIRIVEKILEDLDLIKVPRILVLNKIDRVDRELVRNMVRKFDTMGLSAYHRTDFDLLIDRIRHAIPASPVLR